MSPAEESSPVRPARWRLFDPKFRHNRARYAFQAAAVALSLFVVLLALDSVRQTVLIASLGASAFIAFWMPRSYPSRPRALLGGYLVGTVVGCGCGVAAAALAAAGAVSLAEARIVCGALATGIAFLVMVTTNTEHPPAAALALGYVFNEWDGMTVLAVLGGIATLSLVKELLRPRLMDLM